MDAEIADLDRELRRLVRHFGRQRFVVEDVTIHRGSYTILCTLDDRGVSTPTEIAFALHVHPSTISRQLAEVEGLGLVNRVLDRIGKRRALLELSHSGRRVADLLRQREHDWLSKVLADWPADEIEALVRRLSRFNEAAQV